MKLIKMRIHKSTFWRITEIVLLSLLISSFTKFRKPNSRTVQDVVDRAVERSYDGMIFHVNSPNQTVTYTSGWHDIKNKIPTKQDALFKIASISKLYIAAATTKLIQKNHLRLDDTLAALLPEVENRIAYADQITLRMLLQHRSGIPEYIFNSEFAGSDPDIDYMSTIALIFDTPEDFKPNKKYSYCNTNYLIIGEILDRTLGYSHHYYIKSHLLEPLKLYNTFSLSNEVAINTIMSGYYKNSTIDYKLTEEHTRPGGSMVATAQDVAIFVRALIDGSLFTPEEQEIYNSVYTYEHTGWVTGYSSIVRYHKDIDAVIVQFVNTSKGRFFWVRLNGDYNRIVKTIKKDQTR